MVMTASVAQRPKPYRELGAEIRRAREAFGLKQIAFAKRFAISQANVTKIENGYGRPSSALLGEIARYFGADYADYDAWLRLARYDTRSDPEEITPEGDPLLVEPEKRSRLREMASYPAEMLDEALTYLAIRGSQASPELKQAIRDQLRRERQGGAPQQPDHEQHHDESLGEPEVGA